MPDSTDLTPSQPTVMNNWGPDAPDGSDQAAEDARFAAELIAEIATKPAIPCQVQYFGGGAPTEIQCAVTMLHVQAQLMQRRHPWLDFGTLESIIFHHDYSQALSELSERTGKPCVPTSEPTAEGVAMVVKVGEDSVIVMEAGLLLGITSENDERQALCMDTVLHELCHVHDNARKARLLEADLRRGTVKMQHGHVFTAADAAWSEYFANRYSDSVFSSADTHPKLIEEIVPAVIAEVAEALASHQLPESLIELVDLAKSKVKFLFQCFGYAAGRLSARGATLDEIAPRSAQVLRDAGLHPIWLAVYSALNRLDDTRESWTSFDDYQPLMDEADKVFRILDMNFVQGERGMRLYIRPHAAGH